MEWSLEAVLFYLITIDTLSTAFIAFSGRSAVFTQKLGVFGKYLPITRGWAFIYLVLVLWLGYALTRIGVI